MDGLSIKHCFVFNPTLKSPKKKPSDDEAQDAKLLFYYPSTEELLVKRSNIGIIEGTLSFMNSFQQTNSSFLLTELNKFYFVANNYENDFIIVFILEKKSPMFSYYQNVESKKKWLKQLLDNFYEIFAFFHQSLTKFFLDPENPKISPKLSEEQLAIFEDFTVNFIEYFSKGQKLPFLDNMVYFPLSEHVLADIILAVQRLNEKIPEIAMSSIIYRGNIIHNQLPLSSFSLLYNIFYSSFEFTPKFSSFNKAPFEVIQSINLGTTLQTNSLPHKEKAPQESEKGKPIEEKKEENKKEEDKKEENKKEEEKKEGEDAKKEEEKKEGEESKKEEEKKEETKPTEISAEKSPSGNPKSNSNTRVSPFRKAFDLNITNNEFLIGVRKASGNNYHLFVPIVHIRQMDENYKLLAYYFKGMVIFLFLNEKFDEAIRLNNTLMKVEKWVEKYFKDLIPCLEEINKRKTAQQDNVFYAYCNNANKSLKLSSHFFNKKSKTIDPDKMELLQRMFLINNDVELTSLTKIKGNYFYYLNSCERNVLMIYNENLSLKELKKIIDDNKRELFDSVYII
ncbi:MAG: hypothetical protein MJ252_22615 [archaeon]|nr:hypothetical protein [archaeon]